MRFFPTILSLAAALAIATPTDIDRRAIVCTSSVQDVNGQRITISCGKDWSGPSYRQTMNVASANDCANQCAADPQCTFASLFRGFCYFKSATSGLNSPTLSSDYAAIDIKPVPATNCIAGTTTINGRSVTTYCAQDYVGVSYAQAIVDDATACANQCAADPNCNYASFWRVHCYFKSSTTGLGPAQEVTAMQVGPASSQQQQAPNP